MDRPSHPSLGWGGKGGGAFLVIHGTVRMECLVQWSVLPSRRPMASQTRRNEGNQSKELGSINEEKNDTWNALHPRQHHRKERNMALAQAQSRRIGTTHESSTQWQISPTIPPC